VAHAALRRIAELLEPLAVVASDTIYQSIIRHGYDGLDGKEFGQLVNVTVGQQPGEYLLQVQRAGAVRAMCVGGCGGGGHRTATF